MAHDYGHIQTEKELKALERRIARLYREASEELGETITAYFDRLVERDKHQHALLMAGEITEEQYKQWRLNQIGRGARFEALRDAVAERYTNANETAVAYVNDTTPGIYSLNRNYAAYTIEQQTGESVGFTLWDEQTVKRLIVEEPDLMPYYPVKKAIKRGIDLAWGKQQITKQITSGILQGESIGKIANRLQKNIPTMNRDSAIRTARTAATGAQNAGRMDTYREAEKKGIELEREWVATLDNRTRHAHQILDGQKQPMGKPFNVDGQTIMYPGDPTAKPYLVYNCRCTLVAVVSGVDTADAKRRAKNPDTGDWEELGNITYREWQAAVVDKCDGLSIDSFLVPVNASENEIKKYLEMLDYETAEKLVGAQTGLSYRAYARASGMSSWGHAMFADSTSLLDVYGGDDPKWFSVAENQIININDLREDIIAARWNETTIFDPVYYENLNDDDFFAMFDPVDIVDSAAAYDAEDLTQWLWEEILEPKGIAGVKTYDGAIVYDPSVMVRNLPMEVYTKGLDDKQDIAEAVIEAVQNPESEAMREYLDFKKAIIDKYGVDDMWSDMTDEEMDKLDRLERIAYKGK